MKSIRPKLLIATATAAIVIGGGWAVAQKEDMSQDMHMMKEMMMNRPAAMKQADKNVQTQKAKATKEGKYTCCLRHPCDFCAMHMGQCPCGKNAAADKPVCNECKGSWYAGDGAVPGKSPDQIKTLPRPLPM